MLACRRAAGVSSAAHATAGNGIENEESWSRFWKSMLICDAAAYWVAFGPHGPRALPPPGEGLKVFSYTMIGVVVAGLIFGTTRMFAREGPSTMNKEWQEATNEYMKVSLLKDVARLEGSAREPRALPPLRICSTRSDTVSPYRRTRSSLLPSSVERTTRAQRPWFRVDQRSRSNSVHQYLFRNNRRRCGLLVIPELQTTDPAMYAAHRNTMGDFLALAVERGAKRSRRGKRSVFYRTSAQHLPLYKGAKEFEEDTLFIFHSPPFLEPGLYGNLLL